MKTQTTYFAAHEGEGVNLFWMVSWNLAFCVCPRYQGLQKPSDDVHLGKYW